MEPSSSSFSLNYIHALELDQQYDAILKEAARFCSHTDMTLGGELQSLKVRLGVTWPSEGSCCH